MTDKVRTLTSEGNKLFAKFLEELSTNPFCSVPINLLTDSDTAEEAGFVAMVEHTPLGRPFENRFEFGTYLAEVLANADRREISLNPGLWNWLTLYFFDQLCPLGVEGRRIGSSATYFLPTKYQYNRYYRHLVRTSWLAYAIHGPESKVLLIPISQKGNSLVVRGEIVEQIASRQGVFRSKPVVSAVYRLYFDERKNRPKTGSGGSSGGSPRRLGQILKQFALTYDLEWGGGDSVLTLMPHEFKKWKQ